MATNKISLSLGTNRKPPLSTNGVKRPRAALQDEEDETHDFGRSEKVSHFDKAAGGAIDESKKKEDTGPLVIARQSNRDWREAANTRKRQKSGLPNGAASGGGDMDQKMKDVEAADAAKKPGFGLNRFKKRENGAKVNGLGAEQETTGEESHAEQDAPKQRTDDELAMNALLGKTASDKTLTIEQAEPLSESDAFKHDYHDAPDMATLDEYARVPVEQFGAALLRGMGWKDGEGIGSQRGKKMPKDTGKLPERRAALLGIGAKEDLSVAAEIGAWGRNAKGGKEVKIYNPVLLRDKKTGEMFTEDELKKKQEQGERAEYEEEFERKEKEREKRRRRDEDDLRDRRRGDSRDRRREKGRDREDRRDRDRGRRKYVDESDEEYYRRKEKERRRRKERDRDDYDDRERSRRHRDYDDDRDRRREKDRDCRR